MRRTHHNAEEVVRTNEQVPRAYDRWELRMAWGEEWLRLAGYLPGSPTSSRIGGLSMLRITSEVTCYGGESTHWLVIRVPLRHGRPTKRDLPPPIVEGYRYHVEPVIETLRSVATPAERRAIDKVVSKIIGEEGDQS